MNEELSHLSAADIDSLPFGYVALGVDGTIRKYNRYEADLARKDPQEVLGKNFFREVAPCTQVQEFEGRFRSFVEGENEEPTLEFDFEFDFRHGSQQVRIAFVRSPLEQEIIMTVNRVRDLGLPHSAVLEQDISRGRLADSEGQPVVATRQDFWVALEATFEGSSPEERQAAQHRLGARWGQLHALRVESFVQREHLRTLREVELQVALESLSGSIGNMGLGRFDVHLGYRDRGLLLVTHHQSPFASMLSEREGFRCAILAGLHAGFLSYVAGRHLVAREITCSQSAEAPCRFLVGTERRLERLFDPVEGSTDDLLLQALGVRSAPGADDE
ncbi:MAG: PAS domain-containing protein [Acidobacteriota bacterium]|nr:PAS domain-containing protein [Acidobacteriota bacterium]